MKPKQLAVFIALSLIWGASFLWIKIAVRETGPFTIVAIRLLLALVVLAVFMFRIRPKIPWRHPWWGRFVIQGLFSTAVPWVLITWAEKYIESAEATVLNATVPLFTLVIAHFYVSDDRITLRKTVGLLLGFAGVILLVSGGLTTPRTHEAVQGFVVLGIIAMILASFSYGFSNVYARIKFRGIPPIIQTFCTMLPADIVMWILAPVVESPLAIPRQTLTWAALTWLGVLGAGIGYVLFYRLLHQIGPTRVSLITYVIPVVGVTLGVTILKERFDWSLAVGTLLIIAGVWGVSRKTRKQKSDE